MSLREHMKIIFAKDIGYMNFLERAYEDNICQGYWV